MLLSEDLLLLVTDDDTGGLRADASHVDVALGGANLVELTMTERVGLTTKADGKAGRLVVHDASPTGDQVLDDSLQIVADKAGKKPQDVVGPLGKKLRVRLYGRLVDRGILRFEAGKVLGLFPTKAWPTVDAAHERQMRARIEGVLVQGVTPDERTAALISLLHGLRATAKVVDHKALGVRKRDVDARAKEIAEGDWGSEAVRKAVDAMNAAVTAAVMVATSSAATSGSN